MTYIPVNPVVNFRALWDRRRLPFPAPGIFSIARHALLAYLRFRAPRRVLLPDYMCFEVAVALRDAGFEVGYYKLDDEFEVDVDSLKVALKKGPPTAVIVTHFYGRLSRELDRISELCAKHEAALIEDCVHLPFPYGTEPESFVSDAKLFSLRKVYPVPFGASIVLREGQDRFAAHVAAHEPRCVHWVSTEFLAWAGKQAVKKAILAAKLDYKTEYRDLSSDPLREDNFAPATLKLLLSRRSFVDAVALRRSNYQAYLDYEAAWRPWGETLPLDPGHDIPGAFVITLAAELRPLDLVPRLLERGVPAALGLAIDPEVFEALPPDHRYRRIVVLPCHQSVTPRQISQIAATIAYSRPELVRG